MKDILIEKKTLNRETTEEKMKLRIKSLIWNIRKQKTTNQNKKKKKSKEYKDSLSNLWDNFKLSNICIIGVPEEEKQQEIGSLFEKVLKKNS